jgi:uncharacterized membrane protein YcaP (DUF421 family)
MTTETIRGWGAFYETIMETLWSITDALLGLSATKAEEHSALQVCLRALAVYIVLIGYIRFAKKRFLSEATGLDVILVIVIGSIASRAISGTAPFFSSLAGAFVLILVHWIISYLTRGSPLLSYLIKGKDTVLIRDGKVDRKALAASHMSDDDLAEDLRQEGVEDPRLVKSARLERSRRLSVIKK